MIGSVRWVFWYQPWKGISPPIPTPLCAYCGCEACNRAAAELTVYKRPAVRVKEDGQEFSRVENPKLLAKLPTVGEVLVQPFWDGGDEKGERGLFVFVTPTLIKLLLKIEKPPLKLMVSGRSWDEAWAALETVLKGEDVPWEQDAPRDGKGAKKKK